jgi:allantoate deiminase
VAGNPAKIKTGMTDDGYQTRFDEVGNLYGRLEGSRYPQEVVVSGSHIDTVVNGGNLDGQFGVLAAWLATRWLKETYGAPLRSVEVLSMAEEKAAASRMSSGAVKTFSASPNLKR